MTAQQTARALIEAGDVEAVARLVEALREIALMRPAGDVERCERPRALVKAMEVQAMEALHQVGLLPLNLATLPAAKEG